jgi:hypothetical protein
MLFNDKREVMLKHKSNSPDWTEKTNTKRKTNTRVNTLHPMTILKENDFTNKAINSI